MRKLYLHIGTHRTATSSIQAFLHQNAQPLQRQGYLYPFGVKRHVTLMNRIFRDRGRINVPLDVAELARDIEKRASTRKHPIGHIILSDEDIAMRSDLSILAPLREVFDVKVVFFLRRQDLWLESWYLQNVKWQWDPEFSHLSFGEFMDRIERFHWADYDAYTTHLAEVFGAENLLLQVFEKEQMPEGPVAAFCNLVGIEPRPNLQPAPHVNSSHSPLVSEFMRNLPLDEAPGPIRGRFERACAALDTKLEKSPEEASAWLLDPKARRVVLERFAEGNTRLARRHFGRDTLFLAPLPPADAPIARLELPRDSAELMRRLVAPFLRELAAIEQQDQA